MGVHITWLRDIHDGFSLYIPSTVKTGLIAHGPSMFILAAHSDISENNYLLLR